MNNLSIQHTTRTRGAALLIFAVFFTVASALIIASMGKTYYTDAVTFNRLADTKQNILTADSSIEDVVYRLRVNKSVSDTEVLALADATTTTTITETSGEKTVAAHATTHTRNRTRTAVLTEGGIGAAFNYGIQVGEGGLYMTNSSAVHGNVYSNGPIVGTNSMLVNGDAVSAGPTGHIDGVDVTGSAYANFIEDSSVDGDAYYQTISRTSVAGTEYPGSEDQATSTMPINDETIDQFKTDAEDGGVTTCESYSLSSGSVTLGPEKIDCDVSISGDTVVTIAGPLWINGTLSVSNSAQIRLSSSLGSSSGVIVVDEEANRQSGSRITLSNSTQFIGDPDNGAYVLLVSMNTSASTGGSTEAIKITNSARGDLILYAPYGEIELNNSIELTEVTGYEIRATNSAEITYDEGVASLLFSSGPSGGFRIQSWNDTE